MSARDNVSLCSGNSVIGDVRNTTQTRRLAHYKENTLSNLDREQLQEIALKHKRAEKFIEKDLKDLQRDYSELKACCIGPDNPLSHSLKAEHPLFSIAALFDFRLEYSMDGEKTHRFLKEHHENRNRSDIMLKRPYVLKGYQLCPSCLRASIGISRATLYRHRTRKVRLADHESPIDAASMKLQVKTALLSLIRDGTAEPLPGSEGGEKGEYYQTPFTQKVQLQTHLNELVFKGIQRISSSTLTRALSDLEKECGIFISCAKTKKFMRCDTCQTLNNEKKIQSQSKAPQEEQSRLLASLARKRQEHAAQYRTQRSQLQELTSLAK